MERNSKDIMNIYLRKISLFQDLLNCIIRERDNLINQDVKGIWASLEEKQAILKSIEETKNQFNGISERDITGRNFLPDERDEIMELSKTIIRLKEEIKARVKENVSFINETLDFLHGMISALTSTETDTYGSYSPYGNSRRGPRSLMYQGEV